MSEVTIEQIKEVEGKLIKGDKTRIANSLNINKGIVTQVIKQKNIYLSYAYPVYLAAKDLLEKRNV